MTAETTTGPDETGSYAVLADSAGLRVDQFLARAAELSRARARALVEAGRTAVNARPVTDASARLQAGDVVTVSIPPAAPAAPRPEAIPLEVVFEDEHLIVVDKPVGLVVHPAPGHPSGTLVNALLHHCAGTLSGINGIERPGIVHRLDRDTSGLLVAAKTDRAHRGLAAQFADHGRTGPLERVYQALVWGHVALPRGTIDVAIGRSARDPLRFEAVRPGAGVRGARSAVTHYERMATLTDGRAEITRLSCRLETGRTHQIRVHLAHIGHPVLGDPLYGVGLRTKRNLLSADIQPLVDSLPGQALHAGVLGFEHPVTGRTMRFEVGLPAALARLAARLGDGSAPGRPSARGG